MSETFKDRRQPRPFRILYMSMEAFLRRFILRGKVAPVAPRSEVNAAQAPTPGGEKTSPWKCGVARLDDHNEALFKVIRQFQIALKSGLCTGAVEEALVFLEGHVDGHLPLEEAYLEHIHFPDLADHREGHRTFQHQIHAFRSRLSRGEPSAELELSQLMFAWMRVHVLKEDAVWVEFAKSRRRR